MNAAMLKEIMVAHGDSQSDLARKLGVTRVLISNKLSGKTRWTIDQVAIVKAIYGLTPEQVDDIFLKG